LSSLNNDAVYVRACQRRSRCSTHSRGLRPASVSRVILTSHGSWLLQSVARANLHSKSSSGDHIRHIATMSDGCEEPDPTSPFGSLAHVQGLSGPHAGLVQLSFSKSAHKRSLYVHETVLGIWSSVLRNVLEDTSTQSCSSTPQTPRNAAAASSPSSSGPIRTIQLDDESCTAWVEALQLMYPSVPLFTITWDNAERLLPLADKYDMPCIIGECMSLSCPR
jgi:hypothetical protein